MPERLVERPKLIQELDGAVDARLILVRAPAGYGKTALLTSWYGHREASGRHTAWISTPRRLNQASELVAYIRAAVEADRRRPASPGIGDGASTEALYLTLARVGSLGRQLAIILDDVDNLAGDMIGILRQVVDYAPQNLQLVVASRGAVDIPLARWRVRGEVREIGVDELRFSSAEARRLVLSRAGKASDHAIGRLVERTEGWAGGLCAAVSCGGEVSGAIHGDQRRIRDFFMEEVLEPLSAELRSFLVRSAIFDRFCTELCDATFERGDSRLFIKQIEDAGAFLIPLDNRGVWYRYHALFREFLANGRNHRDMSAERAICLRAAGWFEKSGFLREAFDQALAAGEPEVAAGLLNRHAQEFNRGGRTKELVALAERLPRATLRSYPLLLLMVAWVRSTEWRFEAAKEALELASAQIDRLSDGASKQHEADHLRFLLLHRQMMLAQFADSMTEVERICLQLLESQRGRDPHMVSTIYDSLLFAQREQFKLGDIRRWEREVLGRIESVGNVYSMVWHKCIMGPTRYLVGDLNGALADFDEALRIAVRYSSTNPAVAAGPALLAAEVHYECNELGRARELLDMHFDRRIRWGFVDQMVAGFVTQARLYHLERLYDEAEQLLRDGAKLAERCGFERLRYHILGERLRQLSLNGAQSQALRLAKEEALDESPEDYLPAGHLTSRQEARAAAWVRAAQLRGQAKDALGVAQRWQSFTMAAGALRSSMRWNIQIAQIENMLGDERHAQRALRRAVDEACRGRFVRSFVDEGEVVRLLLSEQLEASPISATTTDRYIEALITAFGGKRSSGKQGRNECERSGEDKPLSDKEVEILLMAGYGLRNKEIAGRLGTTEGTVKWYLQQIYNKVGTRRRAALIERARQMGLVKKS